MSETPKSTFVGTEPVLDPVGTTHGFKQRLARQVSWGLCSGSIGEFDVSHTEWKPETAEVLVHDFAFTDENGTKWRGSFKLTLSELDASVDYGDDAEDWYDDYEDEDDDLVHDEEDD